MLPSISPVFNRPYFTKLDPRARIRGSRDPLGLQPIWTAFGRRIIINLTTVSSSLRNFTTLLLARYFADRALEEGVIQPEGYLAAFLKVEQLCGYSRVAYRAENGAMDEDEIRGIERVSQRLQDGEIRISAREEWQILSDQKTYGLWGLYTVASASSGLLEKDHAALSLVGRGFVEKNYLRRLPDSGKGILGFLEKDGREFLPRKRDKKLAMALASIHGTSLSSSERDFYTHHLLHCQDQNSLQARLWKQILTLSSEHKFDLAAPFSLPELKQLIKITKKIDVELFRPLEDIAFVEAYLAPLDYLFSFLLDRDNQQLKSVAAEIEKAWGSRPVHVAPEQFTSALQNVANDFSQEVITNLAAAARLLNSGKYQELIKVLLDHNKFIMAERGAGDAWVTVRHGKLDVRLRELNPQLPDKKSLPTLWRNSYFLNSLKKIGYQIVRGSKS